VILRNRPFAALTASQLVSSLGTQLTWLAIPWFVLVTTGSVSRMAIVFAVEVLPVALFGVLSGSVVQRIGTQRTLVVCDAAAAPLIALIPLLHAVDALSFGLLLAIVFAISTFSAPYFSSTRLILAELLGDDEKRVAQANSVLEGTTQLAGFAGPALAGVLIAVLDPVNVLWIDAASYLVSFALLALFVPRSEVARPNEPEHGVLAGLRFIAGDRLLRAIAGVSFLFGVFIPFLFAALPVLAYERYDARPQAAGWLFAAWGAGSVAGSFVAFAAAGRMRPLRIASVAAVLCAVPLWFLVGSLPLWGAVAAIFGCAFFVPAINAPILGLFTLRTPPALRGKAMTALMSANGTARPVSYALAGPLLHLAGLTGVFLVVAAGVSAAVAMFVAAAWPADPVTRARIHEEAA
jgi:predicted MFS family arabinose efflux permease